MIKQIISPKVLLSLSGLYLALVAACVGALFLIPTFPTFMEGDRMASGCYITEAFFAGASCHGFFVAPAAELLLQLPFFLFFAPIFGLSALASGDLKGTLGGVFLVGLAVVLWAPLVYLFRYVRSSTQSSTAASDTEVL